MANSQPQNRLATGRLVGKPYPTGLGKSSALYVQGANSELYFSAVSLLVR